MKTPEQIAREMFAEIQKRNYTGRTFELNQKNVKHLQLDVEYLISELESERARAETLNCLPYKIVRTYSAGVFAGFLESRNGQEVVLRKARRLWSWAGAASLSQLAQSGTSKPYKCQFPEEVDRVELLQVIEILDVTKEAKKTIDSVAVWKV